LKEINLEKDLVGIRKAPIKKRNCKTIRNIIDRDEDKNNRRI
tara:strand:+ start:6055 stop:6180 length:126 start_codon:yes stop_codon:yes gene_type:complete